jgi:hypothetical protein
MNKEELFKNIDIQRKKMVCTGLIYGINHIKTIEDSQKLDQFLNKLHNSKYRKMVKL